MVTAIALFQLPADTSLDDATAIFTSTAPRYLEVEGLIRKAYLFEPTSKRGGGTYLFSDRAAAERAFGPQWRTLVTEKYGGEPEVTIFDSPVLVDVAAGEISGPALATEA